MKFTYKYLVVICLIFIGNFGTATAFSSNWVDTPSVGFYQTSNYSVTKNSDYWTLKLISATTSTQGISIGNFAITYPYPPLNISPWRVKYDVISNSNCAMRPMQSVQNLTGLPGSTGLSLSTGATTTTFSFTNLLTSSGVYGVSIYRNAGTADCEVRMYEITDSQGNIIWNPTINSNQYTIYNTTGTSTGSTATTTYVTTPNDQLINFSLLFALLFSMILLLIHLLKPFYARK